MGSSDDTAAPRLPQLPIDVWRNVFSYLNEPVDAELSVQVFDMPDQSHLARLLRVNSEWFLAAGKVLYSTSVCTRYLSEVLLGFDRPRIDASGNTIDLEDIRGLMTAGNFKLPLLRHIQTIILYPVKKLLRFQGFQADAEADERIDRARRIGKDRDRSRQALVNPLIRQALSSLKSIRVGGDDWHLWFRPDSEPYPDEDLYQSEHTDIIDLLHRNTNLTRVCESAYSGPDRLPFPVRLTDFEAGRLVEHYSHHVNTAEPFRIQWGTRNRVTYYLDTDCNDPRDQPFVWASPINIATDLARNIHASLPSWAKGNRQLISKLAEKTSLDIVGAAKHWHWSVEFWGEDPDVEPDPLPSDPAGWIDLAHKQRSLERRENENIERHLRQWMVANVGGTKEFWEDRIKLFCSMDDQKDLTCPGCGTEWGINLQSEHPYRLVDPDHLCNIHHTVEQYQLGHEPETEEEFDDLALGIQVYEHLADKAEKAAAGQ